MPPPSPVVAEWPRLPWFLRGRQLDLGSLVASVLAIATEFSTLLIRGGALTDYLLVALSLAGVAVGRVRAWTGLALVVASAVGAQLFSNDVVAPWTIVVFTLFSMTWRGAPALLSGSLAGVALYLSVAFRDGTGFFNAFAFVTLTTSLAAAATGSAVRARENYWRALKQQAIDAVATRDIEVERKVAEERLRIARDLHDVVGHEVAVVSMHLGVAEVRLPPGATDSRAALESAREGVRRVLLETQHILDVLRRGPGNADEARPVPTVEQIPELIRSFDEAGTTVNLVREGDAAQVEQSVGVTAYRVVQEALTNAQRHGRGAVDLRIRFAEGLLAIVIENDYEPRPSTDGIGRGYGLVGMRERVESAGGKLQIGADERRFRVAATLRTDGGEVR